jgi:cell division septal protein FtsQ
VDVVRKGYSVIKRIGMLVVVALVAAMMLVATAAPAFAARTVETSNDQPLSKGSAKKATVQTGSSEVPKKLNKSDIRKACASGDAVGAICH